MTSKSRTERFIQLITELKEEEVLELVKFRLETGDGPLQIVQDCQKGVYQVGILYQQKKYFVSGLIMAGEILTEVLKLIGPYIEKENSCKTVGKVIIGTAGGDIHDIGKNLFGMLLKCSGFEVYDLGVDVPPEEFLKKTLEIDPHIVGISALLSTTHPSIKYTIQLLKSELSLVGIKIPAIVIGGSQLDDKICGLVDADAWTDDAMEGIEICKKIINKRLKQ
jgi:methylmalonyl-CoA mutase cobalamin-binding domain/chain